MDITYFDQRVDRSDASGTYSTKWSDFGSRFEGYDVSDSLPMWVADMDFLCPPAVIDAIVERAHHGIYGYTNPTAVSEFIQAASKWAGRRYGWEFNPQWGFFVPGVVPAINAAIQEFAQPGEAVIIQTPVYYPFHDGIHNNGRVLLNNQLLFKDGKYVMDFEGLEKLAQRSDAKLMVLCNPHNPVGRVWSKKDLEKVSQICYDNNIVLFSDEIHADLVFKSHKLTTVGSLEKNGHVIVAYAPSKTFNLAGLGASVIVAADSGIRTRMKNRILANRLPKSNTFGTLAGKVAYNTGDEYVNLLNEYIEANIDFAVDYAEKHLPGVKILKPEGTYLVWFDFRGLGLSPDETYRFVLEEAKVAGDLGRWFGEAGEGFVRLNFACPRSIVTEALNRIEAALKQRG